MTNMQRLAKCGLSENQKLRIQNMINEQESEYREMETFLKYTPDSDKKTVKDIRSMMSKLRREISAAHNVMRMGNANMAR